MSLHFIEMKQFIEILVFHLVPFPLQWLSFSSEGEFEYCLVCFRWKSSKRVVFRYRKGPYIENAVAKPYIVASLILSLKSETVTWAKTVTEDATYAANAYCSFNYVFIYDIWNSQTQIVRFSLFADAKHQH